MDKYNEVFKRMQELEALKTEAINELLRQRAEIDERLRKLGYGEDSEAPKQKRKRRTKAEVLAAKEAGEEKPERKARLVKKES